MKKQGLKTFKTKIDYFIEGVDGETMETCEMVEMKIKVDRRGSQILRILAIVLPIDEDWAMTIPENRPPWLSDLAPKLADPEIGDPFVRRVTCSLLLGSDYMNRMHVVTERKSINHTFALASSLAGYIPRGCWLPGKCTLAPPEKFRIMINRLCPRDEEECQVIC